MRKASVSVLLIVALGIAGYFTYQYVKYTPPAFLVKLFTATKPPPPLPAGDMAPLTVPEGFTARIYSRDVPGARVMTRDPKGTMLVSLTSSGKIVALPDLNSDGKADQTIPVLENLDKPHGILVVCPDVGKTYTDNRECTLYVAETGALKAYAYDADTYSAVYEKTLTTFPTGNGHFTRTLLLGQNNDTIFVSVGSSCNACNEEHRMRATIQEVNLENGAVTTYASGLRNTVFMAYHPVTGKMWGTDNGRDLIGDDIPPDEINIIERGRDYGWPFCYGKNIHDTDFDRRQNVANPCVDKTPAHIDLPAHVAALGLAFVPEEGWPEDMWHDLLIAYHGSWNRSEPTGYKVVRFDFTNGVLNDQFSTDFVTGFLPPGGSERDAIGRPVDIRIEPGGVMYISDDRAGAIYRITLDEMPR